jgi:microcin C transport system substrate-binding protein
MRLRSKTTLPLTRRLILQRSALAFAAPLLGRLGLSGLVRPAAAQAAPKWRHGLSLFGELKYPADFKRFDYVNPDAPKGGTVRRLGVGTFDNFNPVVMGLKGQMALGIEGVFETLFVPAFDEVSTEYGLLADAARHPDDFSSVTYRLRAEAKWHDGRPVTPDDVTFSFNAFKTNSPFSAAYYRHVVKAEKTGEREITFTFDGPGNRELPQIVGQLMVLPKHWWEGKDKNGKARDVTETTLEPPLGSGPYRMREFTPPSLIVYERVKDYWGKDLPVNIGRDNFDEMRFVYLRDSTVALEAFKADDLDWRTENSAKNWATAYDFPAVNDKRVLKEEFPERNRGGMQAFAFNTRRDKFKDARVRRAFNFAFDFDEMNKQLFYGAYTRITSYFAGTELACSGLPQGAELAMLESLRDKVPPEVFTTPYSNPAGGSPMALRRNVGEGLRLLREAGWVVNERDNKLANAKSGEPLAVELLAEDPSIERVNLFYKPALERMGISVAVRTVDPTQYENRLRKWDFDIITANWGESLSPGNEQRDFWGSAAADVSGSRNLVGIKNPAVDALIERVIFAKSRDELVAATRALDRVLLWNHYVVPQWTYGKQRTVRWDRFGHPDKMPEYAASAFPTIWWWDADKAAKTGTRK